MPHLMHPVQLPQLTVTQEHSSQTHQRHVWCALQDGTRLCHRSNPLVACHAPHAQQGLTSPMMAWTLTTTSGLPPVSTVSQDASQRQLGLLSARNVHPDRRNRSQIKLLALFVKLENSRHAQVRQRVAVAMLGPQQPWRAPPPAIPRCSQMCPFSSFPTTP